MRPELFLLFVVLAWVAILWLYYIIIRAVLRFVGSPCARAGIVRGREPFATVTAFSLGDNSDWHTPPRPAVVAPFYSWFSVLARSCFSIAARMSAALPQVAAMSAGLPG